MGLRSKPQICSAIYNCCVRGYRVYNPYQNKEEHSNSLVIAFTETWMTIPPTVAHGRNVLIKFMDCKRLLNNHRSCLVGFPVPFGFFRCFPTGSGFSGDFSRGPRGWLAPNRIHPVLLTWLVGDSADGGKAGAGSACLEDLGHSVANAEGGRN